MEKKHIPMEMDDDAMEAVSGGLETIHTHEEAYARLLEQLGFEVVYERSEDSLEVQGVPRTETNAMDKLLEMQNSQ